MMANERKYLIVYLPNGGPASSLIIEAMSEEHARLKFLADHEGASIITVFVELKP